jgi:homopolymeric O-antigen transport system ATP-binding protein
MNVIQIENLWKEYKLGVIGHGTLTQDLQSWWANIRGKEDPNAKIVSFVKGQEQQIDGNRLWALQGIDLEVKEGEILGIIGRNGAGKSTLLKILSRVTAPSKGSIKTRGRIASLLEVGTGFHAELTGRENVYLNGAILGMSKNEVKDKFDEIVEFADIAAFIDTPVKRYSSGMYVRLGFAVAAHLETEIIVVDEVLAVGDVVFQKKCLGKMKDISGTGRTVLFVSHNMQSIKNLCSRSVLVDLGRVIMDDVPESVVAKYLDRDIISGSVATESEIAARVEGMIQKKFPYFQIKEIRLEDSGGETKSVFGGTEPVIVSVSFECFQRVNDLRVIVSVANENGDSIFGSQNTDDTDVARVFYELDPGIYKTKCTFPENIFGNRKYYINIHLVCPKKEHHVLTKILEFQVDFRGYNPEIQYAGTNWAFLWPKLSWNVDRI